MLHRIRRGLNLPIAGAPSDRIEDKAARHAALVGADYVGMKPSLAVREGDVVEKGQLLFECKKTPGVRYTAPAAGRVAAVARGDKRAFLHLEIALEGDGQLAFARPAMDAAAVRAALLESGLWTALRSRPFGRVADPATSCDALFVNAMDTHPLAPSIPAIVSGREAELEAGLTALATLAPDRLYLVSAAPLPHGQAKVRAEHFEGPHPAGNVGLHIHTLAPASRGRRVWHLGVQDAIAVGHLVLHGALDTRRVVALGGPAVRSPRLLRTTLGAKLSELLDGELQGEASEARSEPPVRSELRIVSGSVLDGRAGEFLGRYHQAIAALPEGRERHFLGWVMPGADRFSALGAYLGAFLPKRPLPFTTTTNGSHRAVLPLGSYEQVTPYEIQATMLCRALLSRDLELAESLGALELIEEDVGLLSYVCPGKNDYGTALRAVLGEIEKSI